jgi:hypothetical protein
VIGDIFGSGSAGGGGGDFASELLNIGGGGHGGDSTLDDVARIAGDVLPFLAML